MNPNAWRTRFAKLLGADGTAALQRLDGLLSRLVLKTGSPGYAGLPEAEQERRALHQVAVVMAMDLMAVSSLVKKDAPEQADRSAYERVKEAFTSTAALKEALSREYPSMPNPVASMQATVAPGISAWISAWEQAHPFGVEQGGLPAAVERAMLRFWPDAAEHAQMLLKWHKGLSDVLPVENFHQVRDVLPEIQTYDVDGYIRYFGAIQVRLSDGRVVSVPGTEMYSEYGAESEPVSTDLVQKAYSGMLKPAAEFSALIYSAGGSVDSAAKYIPHMPHALQPTAYQWMTFDAQILAASQAGNDESPEREMSERLRQAEAGPAEFHIRFVDAVLRRDADSLFPILGNSDLNPAAAAFFAAWSGTPLTGVLAQRLRQVDEWCGVGVEERERRNQALRAERQQKQLAHKAKAKLDLLEELRTSLSQKTYLLGDKEVTALEYLLHKIDVEGYRAIKQVQQGAVKQWRLVSSKHDIVIALTAEEARYVALLLEEDAEALALPVDQQLKQVLQHNMPEGFREYGASDAAVAIHRQIEGRPLRVVKFIVGNADGEPEKLEVRQLDLADDGGITAVASNSVAVIGGNYLVAMEIALGELRQALQLEAAKTIDGHVRETDDTVALHAKIQHAYAVAQGVQVDQLPAGLLKTVQKMYQAIVAGDEGLLVEILDPSNKISRKAFESLFDDRVKLPKAQRDLRQVVRDFMAKVSDRLDASRVVLAETYAFVGRKWLSVHGQCEVSGVDEDGRLLISAEGRTLPEKLDVAQLGGRISHDEKQLAIQKAAASERAAVDRGQPVALDGFVVGMNPARKAKAIAALNKQQGFNGVVKPRGEMMAQCVAAGYQVVATPTGRRLVGPTGGFWMESDITKTAMDFAQYLIEQQAPEAADNAKQLLITKVDAAYRFESATDDFKVWVSDSVDVDSYSPFRSAKLMDAEAKSHGGIIRWGGYEKSPHGGDWCVRGVLEVDGKLIARVDLADNGKSMVFLGESGDERVGAAVGQNFYYSENTGPAQIAAAIATLGPLNALAEWQLTGSQYLKKMGFTPDSDGWFSQAKTEAARAHWTIVSEAIDAGHELPESVVSYYMAVGAAPGWLKNKLKQENQLSENGSRVEEAEPTESVDRQEASPEIKTLMSDATFKSWLKSVNSLGKVNGWTLFHDSLVSNRFVLMTGYNSVGFETEQMARDWAAKNRANLKGLFVAKGDELATDGDPAPVVSTGEHLAKRSATIYEDGFPRVETEKDAVYKRWQGSLLKEYEPLPYQARLITAVQNAIANGKFYNTDVNAFVKDELGSYIPEEAWQRNVTGVQNGDIGHEIYHAREYVESQQAYAAQAQAMAEHGWQAGDKFSKIRTNDGRTYTSCEINSISEDGRHIVLSSRRGGKSYELQTEILSLVQMVDRAGGKTIKAPQKIVKSATQTGRDEIKLEGLRQIDAAISAASSGKNIDALSQQFWKEAKEAISSEAGKFAIAEEGRRAYVRQKLDEAIGYITISTPGNGKFQVLNTKERLLAFRRKFEAAMAKRDAPAANKVTGVGGSLNETIIDFAKEGEWQNVWQLARDSGRPLAFGLSGKKSPGPVPYIDVSDVELAVDGEFFVGRELEALALHTPRSRWAVIEKSSGLAIVSQRKTKAEALSDAKAGIEKVGAERVLQLVKNAEAERAKEGIPFGQDAIEAVWMRENGVELWDDEPSESPVHHLEALRDGDIVRDSAGNLFIKVSSRLSHGIVTTTPLADGQPEFSHEAHVRFQVRPELAEAYSDCRADPIYATGRNYYDENGGVYWIDARRERNANGKLSGWTFTLSHSEKLAGSTVVLQEGLSSMADVDVAMLAGRQRGMAARLTKQQWSSRKTDGSDVAVRPAEEVRSAIHKILFSREYDRWEILGASDELAFSCATYKQLAEHLGDITREGDGALVDLIPDGEKDARRERQFELMAMQRHDLVALLNQDGEVTEEGDWRREKLVSAILQREFPDYRAAYQLPFQEYFQSVLLPQRIAMGQQLGIDREEILKVYANPSSRKAAVKEWITEIRNAAKAGEDLPDVVLDDLFYIGTPENNELRALLHDAPSYALPDSYILPDARLRNTPHAHAIGEHVSFNRVDPLMGEVTIEGVVVEQIRSAGDEPGYRLHCASSGPEGEVRSVWMSAGWQSATIEQSCAQPAESVPDRLVLAQEIFDTTMSKSQLKSATNKVGEALLEVVDRLGSTAVFVSNFNRKPAPSDFSYPADRKIGLVSDYIEAVQHRVVMATRALNGIQESIKQGADTLPSQIQMITDVIGTIEQDALEIPLTCCFMIADAVELSPAARGELLTVRQKYLAAANSMTELLEERQTWLLAEKELSAITPMPARLDIPSQAMHADGWFRVTHGNGQVGWSNGWLIDTRSREPQMAKWISHINKERNDPAKLINVSKMLAGDVVNQLTPIAEIDMKRLGQNDENAVVRKVVAFQPEPSLSDDAAVCIQWDLVAYCKRAFGQDVTFGMSSNNPKEKVFVQLEGEVVGVVMPANVDREGLNMDTIRQALARRKELQLDEPTKSIAVTPAAALAM
ncbi:hypothetical protein [Vogesella sp. XCS3]|uniref:hypothetical protein n=1 Tax=Vogesella sp. XCS3 TaxID=2877939 RepID=UPI001D0A7BCF|nr:hypothetical protein [Vogesella sp. XCS3]UDM18861.1 hypothetical protein LCH97_18500 [Vogesella sp. XCS3]